MAYNNTYVALDKVTVGTATATVTFSSIPQGYTDLVVVASMLATSGTPGPKFYLNNDTSALYSETTVNGNGSTTYSGRNSNANIMSLYWTSGLTTTEPRVATIHLQNYANTSVYKTMLSRFSLASGETGAFAYLYRSTSAINRIDFTVSSSTFAVGSTFSLYGIAATGSNPTPKASGGTITYDSQYTYHTFLSTGTFTPSVALNADILVIAGGGGGNDGGGGAGGIAYYTGQSLSATGYTCTVGAGGAIGNKGVNSSFTGLTAAVGGGRATAYDVTTDSDSNGGSGAGAARKASGGNSGGTGTSGQGNNGGAFGVGSNSAGGGGGAGAVGAASTGTFPSGIGGNGGAGTALYSSWGEATSSGQNISGTRWYAGGGGGFSNNIAGTGGTGGGGNGSTNSGGATSGTANTGSGGGGAAGGGTGAGGSGIVIVRYASV